MDEKICCGTCRYLRFDDGVTFHCFLDDDQVSLTCCCAMYVRSLDFMVDLEEW